MSALTEFLFPTPARRTVSGILLWWEKRRLAYNLWVGTAGAVSVLTVSVVGTIVGDGLVHRYMWVPVLIFGVMANVCYFLGPATELIVDKLWGRRVLPTGPTLFRMGLTFSVGLALFPGLLAVLMLVAWTVASLL